MSHAGKELDRLLKSGKVHEADIVKLESQLRKVQLKASGSGGAGSGAAGSGSGAGNGSGPKAEPAPVAKAATTGALLKEQRQETMTPSTPGGKSIGATGVGDEWGLLLALEKYAQKPRVGTLGVPRMGG